MKNIFLSKGLEYLKSVVIQSSSLGQVMDHFSYSRSGSSYSMLKKILIENNIDFTHFSTINLKPCSFEIKSNDYYFVENSKADRSFIKNKIIKDNLKEYRCEICNLDPNWCGKELSLHLDHINGINNDNRLDNLRFLCPNCHSQTPTYSGKSKRNRCENCFKFISNKSTLCLICSNSINRQKQKIIFDIDPDILKKEIWQMPMTKLAEKYGCSDKLIAKKCKKFNIQKPPRGFFNKN